MRSIGKVLGEATIKGHAWGGGTEVTNRFVIDVGSANASEALNKASDLLLKLDWVVVGEGPLGSMVLESDAWEDTHLTVDPFNPSGRMYPEEIKKAIEASTKPEALLLVDAYQS
ncbi:hypothetical protein [Streptosporangium subroseum]|uniref:hypothetical protein n=1 Tax=Streptosporangium subroseum TaxID=106412 RepID=UPI0030879C5B|nr:hypothetical protein OHB15_14990 [Streptosporangium subroseum]